MDQSFDFDVYRPGNRVKLARVINHIADFAHPLHGKGGCSAHQITVEFARCLVAAFTFSLNDSSPPVDQVTSFVIRCKALVLDYEGDDQISTAEMRSPPDKECWAFFFYLVTKELDVYPNQSIACEHSTFMVAKIIHFARWVTATIGNKPVFDQLCQDFADAQLKALDQRARREPTLLYYSIFGSLRSVIYKPTSDASICALHVARFLGHSLREHNIVVCIDNINRALAKVLASCALWNGFHVGHLFAAQFMQRFLPYSVNGIGSFGRDMLAPDFQTSTTFLRLVHYCAAIWQSTADVNAHDVATELQEEGEAIAVERVLDAVLRNADPIGRLTRETLEAIVVRDPPGSCLTPGECIRILYRRENLAAPVLHAGAYPRNLMALTGAPPAHSAPPACQLTPAEIICYFPNVLCIPEIWSWIAYHGWTPYNIPKFLNRTRGLTRIMESSYVTFRNWQRNASTSFREERDLPPPPPSLKLNISPYVHAYCNASRRGRYKPMVEVSMSRLVYSVKRHPTGDEAGYFTALAKYAAANGDLGGKLLVSHIRRTDDPSHQEGGGFQPRLEHGRLPKSVNGKATGVSENDREDNGESGETGRESDVGQRDCGRGNGVDDFLMDF